MLFAHSSQRDLSWILVPLIEVGVTLPLRNHFAGWKLTVSTTSSPCLQEQELRRALCPTPGEGKALVTGSVWGQKWGSQVPCWGLCQAVPFSAKQRLPKGGKSMGDAGHDRLCHGWTCSCGVRLWPHRIPFPHVLLQAFCLVPWILIYYYN